MRRLGVCLAIIALLSISYIPQQAFARQPAPWINQTEVTQYASNLIDDYYGLFVAAYGYYPNSTIAQDFSLYHSTVSSFKVLVMRSNSVSWDSNITDTIVLLFIPNPTFQVVVENNETWEDAFGVAVNGTITYSGNFQNSAIVSPPSAYGAAFFHYSLNEQNQVVYIPLVWVTSISHGIQNDTNVNAKGAASWIYQLDLASTEKPPPVSHWYDPALKWFESFWYVIVILGVLLGILADVVFLRKEWRPFHGSERSTVKKAKKKPKGH
ncbi:MAG: hypothetical protein ACLQEQ_06750 [Nitrososphaerales archaeon]